MLGRLVITADTRRTARALGPARLGCGKFSAKHCHLVAVACGLYLGEFGTKQGRLSA
jgi:hypothetical protein